MKEVFFSAVVYSSKELERKQKKDDSARNERNEAL